MSKITPLEKIEFEIGKFAIDFLRDYLKFVSEKETVEDVCVDMVFDGIIRLRDRVKALPYFSSEILSKYEHLTILDSREDQEENDC